MSPGGPPLMPYHAAMGLVTIDVALVLPDEARKAALSVSARLVEHMNGRGLPSHFQLGQPFPGTESAGVCEPHVSLFMLNADETEIPKIMSLVRAIARARPAIDAEGEEYRHNAEGAPELYFKKQPEWAALQRHVVSGVEPLRRSRLRELDPGGHRLADVIERLDRDGSGADRLRQLRAYGYDEIADEHADLFNPHVTLAWPVNAVAVDLVDLPPASVFNGRISELAIFGMSPYGTCTTRYGSYPLGDGTFAP